MRFGEIFNGIRNVVSPPKAKIYNAARKNIEEYRTQRLEEITQRPAQPVSSGETPLAQTTPLPMESQPTLTNVRIIPESPKNPSEQSPQPVSTNGSGNPGKT